MRTMRMRAEDILLRDTVANRIAKTVKAVSKQLDVEQMFELDGRIKRLIDQYLRELENANSNDSDS